MALAEISEICWHKLKDLPATREQQPSKDNKFWMVQPFVGRLKRFLAEQAKLQKKLAAQGVQKQLPAASSKTAVQQQPPPPQQQQAAAGGKAKATQSQQAAAQLQQQVGSSNAKAAVPLGTKARDKANKGVQEGAAAPSAEAASTKGQMKILQARKRQPRGHAWLDFAFDKEHLLAALGPVAPVQ